MCFFKQDFMILVLTRLLMYIHRAKNLYHNVCNPLITDKNVDLLKKKALSRLFFFTLPKNCLIFA